MSKKEIEELKEWSVDALDEEIFEAEQTMVNEYVEGRGRKLLIRYWQALQDERTKRTGGR